MKKQKNDKPCSNRDSNLELFRIISMLVIVSHHYVVNSGLIDVIYNSKQPTEINALFLLLFGWGGKTAINCFVLITGYFMCKSNITIRKFFKLLYEVMFYKIVIYFIFIISGYINFEIKGFIKAFLPFTGIGDNFTGCFLIFFLFIPFLNILTEMMTEKQHVLLVGLCFFIYTILPSIKFSVSFNYVTWFIVIYFIASYIRCYQSELFSSKKLWGILTFVSLLVSWASVIALTYIGEWIKYPALSYFFVADSNKILAVITAVCTFIYFKNLNIKNSKIINKIAASCFGVLLIHANSDLMRTWLWKDTLKNVNYYNSPYLILHAIGSVLIVYMICTVIDLIRIRVVEKPSLALFDKIKVLNSKSF